MFETAWEFLNQLLGLRVEPADLEFSHMAWRSVVVFCFAVVLARVGARRFLGRSAGFDIMVAIILGSVLSRGINGEAAFFPSLGASAVLVVLHHLLAAMSCRWHWFSKLVKGSARVLVRDGKVDEREMARCKITEDDLYENLRLNGNENGLADVAEARLERSGTISVVKTKAGRPGA
jgi:uncharacterized membrane protein YcaP (DUF421 family)